LPFTTPGSVFSSCVDELKSSLADPVADRILETLRMSREVGGSELTTVTETVTFRWNASPGAAAYRVWASLDGKPFADLALTAETSVVRELAEGSYVWYLEALYAGCPSVPSARAAFRVDDNRSRCSTDTPTLISPAQGAQVTAPVTLTWTAVDRAKPYRVYGSLDGGQPVLLGVTPETSLTRSLPPGRINWVVEAIFEECPSTRSTGGQFTVLTSQNCSGEKPQLISPAANAQVDPYEKCINGARGRYAKCRKVTPGSYGCYLKMCAEIALCDDMRL